METEFMVYNLVFIMKMTVYYYMARVTKRARQRHFILWLGFRVDVVNLKHSVRYESLIRETRLHPSQLYMSISGFMIVGQL